MFHLLICIKKTSSEFTSSCNQWRIQIFQSARENSEHSNPPPSAPCPGPCESSNVSNQMVSLFSGGSKISYTETPTPDFGAKTYYLARFLPKTALKLKKLNPRGRGHCPGATLGSANAESLSVKRSPYHNQSSDPCIKESTTLSPWVTHVLLVAMPF